jgi:hypothetical protein
MKFIVVVASKFFIVLIWLILLASCNKNSNNKRNMVTIHIPLEGSIYDYDTSFVLYDSIGKNCFLTSDTTTKSGRHMGYENLPNGTYLYAIPTIFGNQHIIRDTIKITSDTIIAFGNNFYDLVDSLPFETLQKASKINLHVNLAGTRDVVYYAEGYSFYKEEGKYYVKSNWADKQDIQKHIFIDSSMLFKSLKNFSTTLVQLKNDDNCVEKKASRYVNGVFILCDNTLWELANVNNKMLEEAFTKFTILIKKR